MNRVKVEAITLGVRSWHKGCGNVKISSNFGPSLKYLQNSILKGYD